MEISAAYSRLLSGHILLILVNMVYVLHIKQIAVLSHNAGDAIFRSISIRYV
jgi:hypothetical protein